MIRLGERIIFVVVALTTRERQAEKSGSGRVRQIGHDFGLQTLFLLKYRSGTIPLSEPQKAGCDSPIDLRLVLGLAVQ